MELRTLRYFMAVAEELHFGRAAVRLHMSQPPLSRAIKQLEAELGAALFRRSSAGVTLTPVGAVLLDEARALLDHADRVRVRVAAATGTTSLTVGILGDSTDPDATRLARAYHRRHPGIEVHIRETDLTDPTCGLHAGLVDIALTRGPFDETGLTVHELRADPVGALLRADDPLARRDGLKLADLADRRWFLFPEGTDPVWQSYWNGGEPREGPVVRGVQECRQAVLWNGTVGMTLVDHEPPDGLTVVPLADMEPSRVVVAWNEADTNPLIRSFVEIATAAYRGSGGVTSRPAPS
ncbi:LysR family transcriptional regulator [Streptomyces rapamycinicus]|uniref:LysR family transcriptional regulator n=2 Tax=Streptomyces rapamycinicus TaxID=1226757 RepID=A0A0A0N3K1_STRRN|nr:LysR substrate-binding domain-containing protein [Streptomyces rapamycinicus]AGP52352.1 LysR family transcriptional regulator [Streptomyces rapamycinicus NRRL 5491]MBB4779817.1 DNA-binding transcriptional LysR family regulator [Streptomyces rapamycinicus]RLV75526.1 LysR family transcriptional regulator [Streptomyces rapamycinicus NRRL 5491]UTP28538.1 LysR family transcriptional regulator [Streptomyces rapamycinicus NRRL 5491]